MLLLLFVHHMRRIRKQCRCHLYLKIPPVMAVYLPLIMQFRLSLTPSSRLVNLKLLPSVLLNSVGIGSNVGLILPVIVSTESSKYYHVLMQE